MEPEENDRRCVFGQWSAQIVGFVLFVTIPGTEELCYLCLTEVKTEVCHQVCLPFHQMGRDVLAGRPKYVADGNLLLSN